MVFLVDVVAAAVDAVVVQPLLCLQGVEPLSWEMCSAPWPAVFVASASFYWCALSWACFSSCRCDLCMSPLFLLLVLSLLRTENDSGLCFSLCRCGLCFSLCRCGLCFSLCRCGLCSSSCWCGLCSSSCRGNRFDFHFLPHPCSSSPSIVCSKLFNQPPKRRHFSPFSHRRQAAVGR